MEARNAQVVSFGPHFRIDTERHVTSPKTGKSYFIDAAVVNRQTNQIEAAIEIFYTHAVDADKRVALDQMFPNKWMEIKAVDIIRVMEEKVSAESRMRVRFTANHQAPLLPFDKTFTAVYCVECEKRHARPCWECHVAGSKTVWYWLTTVTKFTLGDSYPSKRSDPHFLCSLHVAKCKTCNKVSAPTVMKNKTEGQCWECWDRFHPQCHLCQERDTYWSPCQVCNKPTCPKDFQDMECTCQICQACMKTCQDCQKQVCRICDEVPDRCGPCVIKQRIKEEERLQQQRIEDEKRERLREEERKRSEHERVQRQRREQQRQRDAALNEQRAKRKRPTFGEQVERENALKKRKLEHAARLSRPITSFLTPHNPT